MDSHSFSFFPLLIVVSIAFLVPLFLSRFHKLGIPVVVGEILAGMILGKSGFGLVAETEMLNILAILGFSLLMFLSGLEIDFTSILSGSSGTKAGWLDRRIQNPFILGSILFLLTFGGAFLTAALVHKLDLISEPWIIALVLSTTSLGVVVPVLKERGYLGNAYGQSILAAAIIADFASILAISVYVLLRSKGLTVDILLILVLFAVFVAVHRLTALFQKHLPTEKILEKLASPTSQIKLRGAIALALVFIALAESLGIENILGAFLAGVILSMASSRSTSALREKLDGIGYGFFIPIFFVMVGVRFDLPALLGSREAVMVVPFLLLAAYLIKLLPALLLRRLYSWRETLAAGFLLSSRLSLIIAVAAIGFQLGVISPALNASIILVAIITCTFSPIVFNLLMEREQTERDLILIVGERPMVDLLIKQFAHHGLEARRVVISGYVADGNDQLKESILPQQQIAEALRNADIARAQTLIALDEHDDINLRICRQATQIFNVHNVIALVNKPTRNPNFRSLGVRIVNMAYSTALIIESMALSKDAFSFASDLDEIQEVREVKLLNPELTGRRISQLNLPEGVHIPLLLRGGSMLTPDEGTVLQSNDIVTLVGDEEQVDRTLRMFSSPDAKQ